MQVLVTRGGELVCPTGPICDRDNCECAGLAGLASGHLIEMATVADRDDVTFEHPEAVATGFLEYRWGDALGPELTAELAHDMAAQTAEVASWYDPGTQLRADYDRRSDEWTYHVIRSVPV